MELFQALTGKHVVGEEECLSLQMGQVGSEGDTLELVRRQQGDQEEEEQGGGGEAEQPRHQQQRLRHAPRHPGCSYLK